MTDTLPSTPHDQFHRHEALLGNSEEEVKRRAFPLLTPEQIELLRPYGAAQWVAAGDVLFASGYTAPRMVVVLSGALDVIDRSDGFDRLIASSHAGQFVGEMGLLTGQAVYADCVAREPGEVLILSHQAVQEVVANIPELSDILITAFAWRRQLLMGIGGASLTLIGDESSPDVLHYEEFVHRNRIPHRWLARDDPAAEALLQRLSAQGEAQVWVVLRGQKVIPDPSLLHLAKALGLDLAFGQAGPVDLLVVGAGPAGLSAAVYGASEGLSTIAVDNVAIGGQAGSSSRIENYLGFPTGISGGELAFRAEVQALKFGARISVPRRAIGLRCVDGIFEINLDNKQALRARSVVIATGSRYRKLDAAGNERFEGAGIYYAATDLEARTCRNAEVVVVGAGNSAGQAAMFLAGTARCVHLICRGPNLGRSMSQYLVTRLEHAPSVEIHTESKILEVRGDARLSGVTIGSEDGGRIDVDCPAMFVMIGADPHTAWLKGTIALDRAGFIITGIPPADGVTDPPSPYETSLPGVFAVGDVRSGSVKRVASAVGEGSVVISAIHTYLATAAVGH